MKEYSKLLYQRKQTKLQWLQNPSQTTGDSLSNVRWKTIKLSGTKKGISEIKH
jgi:hypothetical protein